MSAAQQLDATARPKAGKGAARAERRAGRTPAVIYGAGSPPATISVDAKDIRQRIFAGHFLTTIFEISLAGATERVIPRDFQLDPVRDMPVHVDFLRLAAGQTIRVDVPVRFLNAEASPGLKRGGTLNIVRHTVELYALPEAIPENLTVDLTGLEINDSVHISAISLPEGVELVIHDRDFTVATIAAPSVLVDVEPTAAAEGAAPAASTAAPAAPGSAPAPAKKG